MMLPTAPDSASMTASLICYSCSPKLTVPTHDVAETIVGGCVDKKFRNLKPKFNFLRTGYAAAFRPHVS